MGAMVGGKLYDMTQFQKHGVFRGTPGVSFGTNGGTVHSTAPHGDNGENSQNGETKQTIVNIDMSNANILNEKGFVERISDVARNIFYVEQGVNPATGS